MMGRCRLADTDGLTGLITDRFFLRGGAAAHQLPCPWIKLGYRADRPGSFQEDQRSPMATLVGDNVLIALPELASKSSAR